MTIRPTKPKRRVLLEIVDYAATTEGGSRYLTMLVEDLNAMLKPAAMEVVDIAELDPMTGSEPPLVDVVLPPACGPAKALLPEEVDGHDSGSPVG